MGNRVKQARNRGGGGGLEAAVPRNGGLKKLITVQHLYLNFITMILYVEK